MTSCLCCKFFRMLYSKLSSPTTSSQPPNNQAIASINHSPEHLNHNNHPMPATPQSFEPIQNLEVFVDRNFSYLTSDEKYFSPKEIEYFKDKYQSPKKKPAKNFRWKPGNFLGQGSYGTVIMGFNAETGEIMAVKQVNLEGNQNDEKVLSLQSEIELLMQFEHPNIVRYLGTNRTQKKLNIFLEYISGGSIAFLLKKYGKFNESIVRQYTLQILKGLEYLHWNKILHRDIKGANVLVDNKGICKLADFGSSKRINELCHNENLTLTGTANWMAPEVIKQSVVSRYSDIWSLGCTVIEMATGKPPWSEYNNPLTTMFYIAKSNEPPPISETFSPDLRDFLQKCLKIIPSERANCHQLINHPFITGNQSIFKEIKIEQSPNEKNSNFELGSNYYEIPLKKPLNRFEFRNSDEEKIGLKEENVVFQLFDHKKNQINDFSNSHMAKINCKSKTDTLENNRFQIQNENHVDVVENYFKKDAHLNNNSAEGKKEKRKIFKKKKSYELAKNQNKEKKSNESRISKKSSFEFNQKSDSLIKNEFSKKNSSEYEKNLKFMDNSDKNLYPVKFDKFEEKNTDIRF